MWHKGSQYLKKMGGIILVASVIIWALGYFPRDRGLEDNHQNLTGPGEAGTFPAPPFIRHPGKSLQCITCTGSRSGGENRAQQLQLTAAENETRWQQNHI
jgi:hypothetical protein